MYLKIFSPKVLNLTLVDLPGITKVNLATRQTFRFVVKRSLARQMINAVITDSERHRAPLTPSAHCCLRFLSGISQRTSSLKCRRWSCPSSPIQTPSSSPCPLPTLTWSPPTHWNWLVRLIQMVGHFVPGRIFSSDLILIFFSIGPYYITWWK